MTGFIAETDDSVTDARYNSEMGEDTPTEPQFEPDDDTGHEHREDSTMIAAKVKVWFLDDDTTPVDFVMFALENYFGYDELAAQGLCESIRENGKAVVAELPAIPAELAKRRVLEAAADSGYPFTVEIEGQQIV